MKKIILLMVLLPMVVFAQKTTPSRQGKNVPTYEELVSTSGICTTYTYSIGTARLDYTFQASSRQEVVFSVVKLEVDDSKASFINISYSGYKEAASVMIEASEAKKLIEAIANIKQKMQTPKPEGADVKYTYITNEGLSVSYSDAKWTVYFEQHNEASVSTNDLEPFILKLQEAIAKCDEIK